MSFERAKAHLARFGLAERIQEFDESSATVELAARAVGCEPARIAKTLAFVTAEGCVLIVAAGDARIDNKKYKARFGEKARMIAPEDVEARTGHAAGGVCPFGIAPEALVYLDVSLERFTSVFPACGSSNSAVEMTLADLKRASGCREVVDVCRDWTR